MNKRHENNEVVFLHTLYGHHSANKLQHQEENSWLVCTTFTFMFGSVRMCHVMFYKLNWTFCIGVVHGQHTGFTQNCFLLGWASYITQKLQR
jgi:hypothetical protein